LIFRSVSSGDDVERVEISEIRLSDDGEQFSHDSVLNSKKEQIDSVHSEVDSVEIKEDRDSVGAVVESTTTVTLCSSLSDQKLAKNRRETEIIPYCGISKDADHLAQLVVMDAYRGNWSDVLRGLDRLERIEKRRDLVRISRLLNVSVRTYRLEQNEFLSETERVIAEKELDSCIHIGIAYIEGCKDKYLPLHELIYCGIKGFQVSRIIEKNPVEAAIQGYSVIVRLEKLLQIDSTMYDACMGLGLFYCSVASASAVIRAALALTGRQISLEKGLSYLRTGARMGHYVNIPSLVYLTQFLSPYLGHHAAEKDSIFMVLQKKCESNPRYLFEQIDENICFHPEKFTMEYSTSLRKKITGYKNVYPHLQCYSELMKYQYCMYIDTLNCIFKTDTVVDLKIYGFYPAFLDALRYKEVCMNQRTGPFSKLHVKDCEKNIAELIKKLEAMPMASTRRELYRWHILDAIKLR
jgi:hypothetical protein